MARIAGEEVAYFEHGEGSILGMILMDRQDRDFAGLVFAPDRRKRYRSADMTSFGPRRQAELALRQAMEAAYHAPAEAHHQGDETGDPIDFFALKRPEKALNPYFVTLADQPGYVPARRIIEPMMRWYDDADGNFIEQFQTTGFDQRIWELYLFAAFVEMGYLLDRRDPIPDYMLQGPFGDIAVEAVTVAPSQGGKLADPPDIETDVGRRDYLQEYMPIKFGSALYSKLRKRYWDQPAVVGKALVFAIEDFSSAGSMIVSRQGLPIYLFGYTWDWRHEDDGRLIITPRKLSEHRWGEKVIPSGFFEQPDSENVSAVLFSNSGTIAKFNRMGVLAGFCPPDVVLVRQGLRPNPDSNASQAIPFQALVNADDYEEFWCEGLEVFHNPNAKIPLDPRALPDATHHYLKPDGQVLSESMDLDPISSKTLIFTGADTQAVASMMARGRPQGQ